MRELQDVRQDLDALDRQLVALFERRMRLSREVAAYKLAHGLAVLDAGREEQVLASRAAMLQDESWSEAVQELYRRIMALSRAEQEKLLREVDGHA